MDIAVKYKIVEKVIQSSDENLLNEVEALMGLSENDFWDTVPTETKEAINDAKAQLDGGLGIPNVDVFIDVERRFLKP